MRILDILLDDLEELHIELAVIHLLDALQDDVLDREVVVVKFEIPTQRFEVRLLQGGAELVRIFRACLFHRSIQQHDRIILEHRELRRVAIVLFAEVGDEALVTRVFISGFQL